MRKLVAALACRNGGSRLYGKPLQNLEPGVTILDQILATIAALPEIDAPVLGVSEGVENTAFVELAHDRGIAHIIGDQTDVLLRLIQCGRAASATDVFRITTECPFIYFEGLASAWLRHVEGNNDITVVDGLPEGTGFEIYRLEALIHAHENGTEEHRSEMCSRYAKQHPEEFKIDVIYPELKLRRSDIRITVDYPEDLILCREIYKQLKGTAPHVPLSEIIEFWDSRPDLTQLVIPYVEQASWQWRSSVGGSKKT